MTDEEMIFSISGESLQTVRRLASQYSIGELEVLSMSLACFNLVSQLEDGQSVVLSRPLPEDESTYVPEDWT